MIIPILTSGFYICNHNPYYYYRLHRYEGQYLYLKSAQLGFSCFAIASFIALLSNAIMPPTLLGIEIDLISFIEWLLQSALKENPVNTRNLTWILLLCFLTQFTSWLWVKLSVLHIKFIAGDLEKSKILLMSTILHDSPLDDLYLNSYIHETPLILSLNDRKIYVGIISSLGEPNESEGMDQEIVLIPMMSGFRAKENLQVTFNTDYQIIDKDIKIVIRQEIIQSATEFDFEVFQQLSAHKKLEAKQEPLEDTP
ncbi:MAG: hypothetical protein MJK04_04935, partial [Psychrosphaera sp.]|nr:hypothetical protein [Psychrosphaera sp.]